MRIDLGKYVITYRANRYFLNLKQVWAHGPRKGKERLVNFAQYTTVYELTNRILMLDVNRADIKTLQQLSDRVELIAREFAEKLKEIK
ncbi:hypothetical protein [Photorhabdus laumondii]|uniref:hypothetical protein n=1 Tax=Photorhabdus laumondii TaxID=2218628 RepID=UPI0025AEF174|nr:hypothetical protein [Photorhabdus laumondii]